MQSKQHVLKILAQPTNAMNVRVMMLAPDCQDDRMNTNFLDALASILRQSNEYNEAII